MVRNLIIFTFLCISTTATLAAITPASSERIYNTTPENRDWLCYLKLTNKFGSAQTVYEFGEIRLQTAISGQYVNLLHLSAADAADGIQAGQATGESTALLAYARSEQFTIPQEEEPTIHFMRNLYTAAFCDPNTGGSSGNGPAEWDILDRSEFVVQLLRASDGEILTRLDSVGNTAYSGEYQDTRYGTNVESIMQSHSLPVSLAGETVFLQISPRRYGPTQYGMVLTQLQNQSWNYSAVYTPHGLPILLEDSDARKFTQAYYDAIIAYCDSQIASTGCMPEYRHFSFGGTDANGSAYLDLFAERYFVPHPNGSGYQLKYPMQKRGIPEGAFVQQSKPAALRSISPNPTHTGTVQVNIIAQAGIVLRLQLYNATGQSLGVLWQGKTATGENIITLDTGNIACGAYFLHLEESDGTTLMIKELVIDR